MNIETYKEAIAALAKRGWRAEWASLPHVMPGPIRARYSWVPESTLGFLSEANVIAAPDDKCWFLTGLDFCGAGEGAFTWDEWEKLSLDAADDDDWRIQIRRFWDEHFPIMASVRGGYAYLAIERESLTVVSGVEPEFEETSTVADSVEAFVGLLKDGSPIVAAWS